VITIAIDLRNELEAAFHEARGELIGARLHQQKKDTPAHRSAVLECRAHIDRLLDAYLEMCPPPPDL
jgi:hypothetical protein